MRLSYCSRLKYRRHCYLVFTENPDSDQVILRKTKTSASKLQINCSSLNFRITFLPISYILLEQNIKLKYLFSFNDLITMFTSDEYKVVPLINN